MLEFLERLFSLRVPVKRDLGGGKSMERSSYCAEAPDKPPVKVRKSKELLNLFTAVWSGPICHSTYFSRIHLYSSRGYNKAQERNSIGMEDTLFCFDIQVVFKESFQNLVYMVLVFNFVW